MGGTEIRIARQPFGSVSGPRADWLYICDAGGRAANLGVNAANRGYYFRRITPVVPISQVAYNVAVSSGNICIAAFAHDSANNRPGARLATTGSFACPAAGERLAALGATVTPEWLYFGADNTSVLLSAIGGVSVVVGLGEGRACYQDTAFPAPTNAVPAAFVSGNIHILVGKP